MLMERTHETLSMRTRCGHCGNTLACRMSVDTMQYLVDAFLSLPRAQSINLNLVPGIGDALAESCLAKLRSGQPWKLKHLLFAYCDLSPAGLKALAAVLRLTTEQLHYVVVSGALFVVGSGCCCRSLCCSDRQWPAIKSCRCNQCSMTCLCCGRHRLWCTAQILCVSRVSLSTGVSMLRARSVLSGAAHIVGATRCVAADHTL